MKLLELTIIISLLAAIASPFLFFYFTERILITEVIPADQDIIPRPNVGDHIEVHGPWVNDTHGLIPDWNEIHPIRYLKNIDSGEEGGNKDYDGELMAGVHNPPRLRILDEENPYRIARGTVVDVFTNPEDGDWHVHLILDDEYQYLANKNEKPLFYIPVLVLFGLPIAVFIISSGIWVYRKFAKK